MDRDGAQALIGRVSSPALPTSPSVKADHAQTCFWQYAMMTGTTVKEVHEEMELSLTE